MSYYQFGGIKNRNKFKALSNAISNKVGTDYDLYFFVRSDNYTEKNKKHGEIIKRLKTGSKSYSDNYDMPNRINNTGTWAKIYPTYDNDTFERKLMLAPSLYYNQIFIMIGDSISNKEVIDELQQIYYYEEDDFVNDDKFTKFRIKTTNKHTTLVYWLKNEDDHAEIIKDIIDEYELTITLNDLTDNTKALPAIIKKYIDTKTKTLNETIRSELDKLDRLLKDYEDTYKEYIDNNKKLESISQQDGRIKIITDILNKYMAKNVIEDLGETDFNAIGMYINSEIFNFDEHVLTKMLNSPRLITDMVRKIYSHTFLKDDYSLLTRTDIYFDYEFQRVTGDRSVGLSPSAIFSDKGLILDERSYNKLAEYTNGFSSIGIPNPHIAIYNCWGTNGPQITKLLTLKTKFEEAFMCILASLGNLNLNDTTVREKFEAMINSLYYNKSPLKCIRDNKTGELLTVYEFYEKVKEEKKEDEVVTAK